MANQPKKYKKFVATAATATLVASAIVPVASAASFSDVPADNEFAQYINALTDEGIINGYPSTNTFKPAASLTRGQVVKMLGRWVENNGVELPSDWKTKAYFKDVPTNHKDQELVKYAALVAKSGVFGGAAGNLMAEKNITRQQMAKVLNGAYAAVNGQSLIEIAEGLDNVRIPDLGNASAEYEDAIQALMNLEISSTTSGNFRPLQNVTRAQFSKFLYNTINFEAVNVSPFEIKAVNNTTVEVIFEDEIENIDKVKFEIDGLKITNAVVKQTSKRTAVLTTESQKGGTEYTVNVDGEKAGTFVGIAAVVPTKVDVVEKSVQGKLGQQVTVKAQVTVADGASKAGIPVTLFVPGSADGIKAPVTVEALTDENGVATHTYTRYAATTDAVTVYATGDRSKFSTGYVFWGVDTILQVEEVTTGSTINNNSNKTYKVTYKNPTTGKVVANKDLNVSFLENINVAANEAKNATVNGVAVRQLTNNTTPKTAVITTDSKGEATFTVSGANTEVTPVVFDLNDDRSNGVDYASYYEADLLQTTASKVKFGALQAEYSIELTRDGGENAAFGYQNGRKYKVLVKDKDGKVAKNEIVNIAFNEDLDRVISTNTKAKFVELDSDGRQVGFYTSTPKNGNTESKISVKTNANGEASFVIGSPAGNVDDYATPIAWIDINNSSAKDGQLDEGEPKTVGQITYFETAKLTGGKLVSVDANGDAQDKFKGNETAKFAFQLTNQSGKKIAIADTNGYDTISATYTVTNTGDNDVEVTSNGKTVTVAPNRDYTVTAADSDAPFITVKPVNPEKSAAVKVTANAIVKDLNGATGLKPFTITTTSETNVSFTGTKEVGNLEKGIIHSFNLDKQTFTISGKNPVKYAGETGKTYTYRDLDNRPVSVENFEKELVNAAKSNPAYGVEITYEVKDNDITFYLKSVSGSAPINEVIAAENAEKEALAAAKTALDNAIKAVKVDDYVDSAEAQKLVDAARVVYNKADATKAQYETAKTDLETGLSKLAKKDVDPAAPTVTKVVANDTDKTVTITFASNVSTVAGEEISLDGKKGTIAEVKEDKEVVITFDTLPAASDADTFTVKVAKATGFNEKNFTFEVVYNSTASNKWTVAVTTTP